MIDGTWTETWTEYEPAPPPSYFGRSGPPRMYRPKPSKRQWPALTAPSVNRDNESSDARMRRWGREERTKGNHHLGKQFINCPRGWRIMRQWRDRPWRMRCLWFLYVVLRRRPMT